MLYGRQAVQSKVGLTTQFFEWAILNFFFQKNFFLLYSYQNQIHKLTGYSRVHISSEKAFLKILKKPSIVQE